MYSVYYTIYIRRQEMKLKDLFAKHMVKNRYRQSDIAKILNKTRQAVFLALNRDIEKCSLKTVKLYAEAIGLKCNLRKVIRKEKQ